MTIVKPMRLGLISRAQHEPPKVYFFVTALGYFDLLDPRDFDLETRMWPMVAAALGGAPLDVGMPKPRGEVLVVGAAAAPGGRQVTQMAVEFAVGPVRKRLTVIGDRQWELTEDGPAFTRPAPFTRMPLSWDRAFGGPEFIDNPAGTGHGAAAALSQGRLVRLPNIESAVDLILDAGQTPIPAGCAPLDPMAPGRQRFAGTYDADWLKRLHPGHAADFNWAFYNTAPQDQWFPGFLNGDERIRIAGMHPDHPTVESRIPGMRVRAFLDIQRDRERTLTEVAMRCETVVLFPDRLKGVVIYRGGTEVADIDGKDVGHTLLAYERLSEPERDIEHYARALKARTDPETAALSFFDEKPLRPEIAAAELGERQAERDAAAAERDEKWDRRTEAAIGRAYAAIGALPPPPGALPKSRSPVDIPVVTAKDIERMDVDMVGVMAALNKLKAYGDEQIAAARTQAATMLGELTSLTAGPGGSLLGAANAARIAAVASTLPAPPAGAPPALPPDLPTFASLRQELAASDPAMAEADPFEAVIAALQASGPAAGSLSDEDRSLLRARAEGRAESRIGAPMLAEIEKLDPTAGGQVAPGAPVGGGTEAGGTEAFLKQLGLDGAVTAAVDGLGPGAGLVKPLLAAAPPEPARSAEDAVEAAKAAARDAAGKIEAAFATARRMSPEALAPLEPLSAEAAEYLGEAVRGCLDDLRGRDLAGRDWSGARLAGTGFAGLDLRGTMFEGADLTGADFRGAMLEDAVFTGANIAGADFSNCAMRGANLSAATGAGARFVAADLTEARLFETKLPGADLSRATLEGSVVLNGDLTRADLSGARMSRVIFITSSFDEAILTGAELVRCILLQASMQRISARRMVLSRTVVIDSRVPGGDFTEADFSDSGSLGGTVYDGSVMRFLVAPRSGWHAASMKGVDLLAARLDGADLGKADLTGSRLRRASLRGAVLVETVLAGADATAATFTEATLRRSDLRGASLRHANLYRAGIDAADLTNCDLTGVNALGTNLLRVADVAG